MRKKLYKIIVAIIALFLSIFALNSLMNNFKVIDRDGDGLSDSLENKIGSNSLSLDSDGDGIGDYDEYHYWMDRSTKDFSIDEYVYWSEYWIGKYGKIITEEKLREILSPDGDIDNDGQPNIHDSDSDGDTLPDGFELKNNTDPAIPNTANFSASGSSGGGNGGGGGGSGSGSQNSKVTITSITEISSSVKKSGFFFVEGYVKDDQQQSVANMTIEVFVNKTKNEAGDFAGRGDVDSDGYYYIICEVPENTDPGSNHIVTHAIPNSNNSDYGSSWSDPIINISSETILNLNMAGSVGMGYPHFIKGTLTDIDNKSLADKEIKIFVNDIFIENIITDDDGVFRTNYTPSSLDSFIVKAVFEGEQHLNSSNNSKTITVKDTRTKIEISIEPTICKRGEQIKISGNLICGTDNPMTGSEINIYYNNEKILTTTTSNIGIFEEHVEVPTSSDLGKKSIKVQYPGNITFAEAISDKNIFVQSETNLKLNEPTDTNINQNETLTISGILTDDLDQAIENKIIFIECVFFNEELRTNENGEFILSYTIPINSTSGSYTFTVRYGGSDVYLSSEKGITITIGQNSQAEDETLSIFLIFIPIIILSAILFFYFFTIKKRKIENFDLKEIAKTAIHDLETETDHRQTVINCYNQMCKCMKKIGIKKAEFQTPREFAKIAEKHMEIPDGYLYDLTEIFEKAQYSIHDIDIDDKNIAIKCLNEIISTEKNIVEGNKKEKNEMERWEK